MSAPFDAGLREPCRDCGSTGGYIHPGCHLPSRSRGLCQACESKHSKKGTLDRYPLMKGNHLAHPVIMRGYTDPYQLGCRRDQHAVVPGYDAAEVIREAEQYAYRWLWRHGRAA